MIDAGNSVGPEPQGVSSIFTLRISSCEDFRYIIRLYIKWSLVLEHICDIWCIRRVPAISVVSVRHSGPLGM